MNWTPEDYALYQTHYKRIKAAYPELPDAVIERQAAEIVNNIIRL